MKWTNAAFLKQPERVRTHLILALVGLIAVQIVLLLVLAFADFNFHFPDPTRLSGHFFGVLVYVYLFALFFGCTVAFWVFHWSIGVMQILIPTLLFAWWSGFFYMFIHGPP